MSRTEEGAALPSTSGTCPRHCEGATPALLGDAAGPAPGACSARVRYRRREATLTYDRAKGRVLLQRANSGGKVVNLANLSTWLVLNIETPEEGALRQARRTKPGLAPAATAAAKPCKRRSFRGSLTTSPQLMETIYPRSRSLSTLPSHHLGNQSRSASGVDTAGLARSTSGGVRPSEPSGCTYYLYYVKGPGSSLRVSTVEFAPLPDAKSQEDVRVVVQAILRGVYPCGAKQLFLFVSPKSGSGNAVSITEDQVLPVLYYTRHEVRAIITTRVFHCEDYIANFANEVNSGHVLVCVGGDGMIHEAVNGLFRRKQAMRAREEAARPTKAFNSHGQGEEQHKSGRETTKGSAEGESSLSVLDEDGRHEQGEAEEASRSTDAETARMTASHPPQPSTQQFGIKILPTSSAYEGARFSMPLVATIPAGSGCGMAKTLGIISVKEGVLALVHLKTCAKDLMSMQYLVNESHDRHSKLFPHNFVKAAHTRGKTHREQEEEREKVTAERIAFMSVTFGLLNDIDRGSEKLRWMGNSRFTVYGAYTFLRGVRSYRVRLRYLPWLGRQGQKMEKLEDSGTFPGEAGIPRCTRTDACMHCRAHKDSATTSELARDLDPLTFPLQDTVSSDASGTLQGELVDFEDDSLPWVALDGSHYAIFLSNIRDAAKDIMMAPLAHMSDGAIDVVFARERDVKCGRAQFLKFFSKMESGEHVHLPFVSYIKARAVELEAVEGFIMSDGEVMPFTKVRVTPLRRAAEFVRGR
ncbi:putative sphingosine kinase A, B [Trypanosoma conorhini]|uniref:Putative sphingosine kinase A, B n=1 Tax=Trypanosoma conorhini TaxID=83891 RepID=A0A3S5IUI7_9TRYP|nr:putative sphingosine kinase A, B [Trypanosoma conorhini]RNF26094.1 putative sphingosine kinase A, B [Trypanosoma conorhini]